MYKHIFFDCADTLLSFDGIRILTEKLGGDEARAKRIHATVFTGPIWWDYDRGLVPFSAVKEIVLPRLDAKDLAIGTWYLENHLAFFFPIDGTSALLADLKAQGYRLYVLSDFSVGFGRLVERFDLFSLFDGLVVSYQHGVSKQDRGLFPRILELYGLDPAECIFFDDRAANIEAAADFGIAGHVYTSVADTRRVLGL